MKLEMFESSTIEYKRIFKERTLKEIVAFLNTDGGILYIGVDDDREIIGVDNIDAEELRIDNKIRDCISPSVLGDYQVTKELHGEKHVIKIRVARGNDQPYYIKSYGMSEKGCFFRSSSASVPMNNKMIDELYSKRTRKSLSNIISSKQDLTFRTLRIYYEENKLELPDTYRNSLELYTQEGKYNYSAYLLSDTNSMSLKVAVYNSNDKELLKESNEFGNGSLIKAANKIIEKLDILNPTYTNITNGIREEWRSINPVSLREAVVNAIIHNDYALNDVGPTVHVFPNRIEIQSVGGLPIGLSKEEFFKGVSNPRNRVLMRVFKDVGLVEQLGSGMSRILKYYDKSIYEISDNYIKVTFPIKDDKSKEVPAINEEVPAINEEVPAINEEVPAINEDIPAINEEVPAINEDIPAINEDIPAINEDIPAINEDIPAINDYEEIIIAYALENEKFRNSDIQRLLNLKSSRTLEILLEMCDSGILEKEGKNKGVRYRIKK